MFQPTYVFPGGEGATKIKGHDRGEAGGGNGGVDVRMGWNGGATAGRDGYGMGGYAGSMYGVGSLYGSGAAGPMMGRPTIEEDIYVTKLFSSRRDLDHVASSCEFSRQFDNSMSLYNYDATEGSSRPGSLYGTGSVLGAAGKVNERAGSLLQTTTTTTPRPSIATEDGMGAAGIGADGGDSAGGTKTLMALAVPKGSSAEDSAKRGSQAERPRSNDVSISFTAGGEAVPRVPTPLSQSTTTTSAAADGAAKSHPLNDANTSGKAGERDALSQGTTPAMAKAPAGQEKSAPALITTAANRSSDAPCARPIRKSGASQPSEKPEEPLTAATAAVSAPAEAPKMAKTAPKAEAGRDDAAATIDRIPLLAKDMHQQRQQPPPTSSTSPAVQPVREHTPVSDKTKCASPVESRGATRPPRPRSRPAIRTTSRLTSMTLVEFPQAEEVNDEMVEDALHSPEMDARDIVYRAEQKRDREAVLQAAREERERERQLIEEAQKEREKEARRRREEKGEEERLRKELVAKMDEEQKLKRADAIAARERQREEEKRRFEARKRAEDDETALTRSLRAEQVRKQAEDEKSESESLARSTSRPRSRRPPSRPASRLRGAIPEQPPDLEVGQMRDTLADDTLVATTPNLDGHGSEAQTSETQLRLSLNTMAQRDGESRSAAAGRTEHEDRMPPSASPLPGSNGGAGAAPSTHGQPQARMAAEDPAKLSNRGNTARATPSMKSAEASSAAARTAQAVTATSSSPTPNSSRPPNMVKTLVLLEKLRASNHAVKVSGQSISYGEQAITVMETKTRPEDDFNYQSSVVHDVREAVCGGYNAAVLALDAPNTAGRFASPVWSVLNRIVRTLLKANSDATGKRLEHFDLTCAIGYLHEDTVKDLLPTADAEASFTKVAIHPSPIYGPRLKNLRYDDVEDPDRFEELLSSTLFLSSQDPMLQSLSAGVVAAFVLIKQMREVDGVPDIFLSSLVVASAGDDTLPYESAVKRAHNEYGTVFHLVLGGPSCTCFMLNISDDDTVRNSGSASTGSVPEGIERVLNQLRTMSTLKNYDLRSGSVKRFIKFVEISHTNAKARLNVEEDEAQRRRFERYVHEQERLLQDAYRMLEDANIHYDK